MLGTAWACESTFSTVNSMQFKASPTLSDKNVAVSVKHPGFSSLS